mmetsp:Transcript_24509/g.31184  ORF Transcript_24509/g.31184 Transcript_24509/m.31184 type:complete len:148 (-) Transcript_24509:65-508(-)|eukprot:CAMPEP_0206197920 /NCGR_PEP_ID=MMETSP0166-20121206/9330_1 /ASSEMBLY_ACC=CAM_ASM_000260 /TAXON_ID=95228 /ORGANISM="Vannella robusta, Strain DIVA3 518/3/11/1/6" /LENGTH=147 /DNA_ID=CAMNT_0053615677 /DNA_START=211 /DNA_END=654 /DNA_ORIENTATION=-
MSLEQFLFIFSDKQLSPVYEQFLQANMAWENFGFYMDVQNFRLLAEEDLAQEAGNIYDKYIEVDSAHELGDITYKLRQNIKESLVHPSRDMFDELTDIVVDSLTNSTVSDFLRDSLFLNYVDEQFASCKSSTTRRNSGIASIFSCIF